MADDDKVDATFWVQVEPEWSRYGNRDGDRDVTGAKAVRITARRPVQPKSGVVMVKLTLRISKSAFLPLRPEAVVVVPDDTVVVPEITATDPNHPIEDGV